MLSKTNKQVSDEDLKSKLLSSLLSTNYQHRVKVKATKDQKDLKATITLLIAYQCPKLTSFIAASAATSSKENTNKG